MRETALNQFLGVGWGKLSTPTRKGEKSLDKKEQKKFRKHYRRRERFALNESWDFLWGYCRKTGVKGLGVRCESGRNFEWREQ